MPDLRCARCSFTTDDDDAAAEHARESGHLRCICCGRRSLTVTEALTCAQCVSRVRADLADVAQGYTLLESATVDALTLLGDGTMQRRGADEIFHRYELDRGETHPLAHDDDQPPVPKPIRDEWPNDPLPVLPALASWEDMIREDYGDPKGPPGPTLTDVIGYLTRHLDTGHRIAQTFHAFDELAREIRWHCSVVQHVAGLANDPLRADARCLDCDTRLTRRYRPPTMVTADTREGTEGEGLTDEWECAACREVYDPESYMLAVRQQQVSAPGRWRTLAVAAYLVERPFRTVQTWMREGDVSSMVDDTGRLVVWMPHVKSMSDEAGRRARKTPA